MALLFLGGLQVLGLNSPGGLVGGRGETLANFFSLARQCRHLPRVLDQRVNGRRARCLPLCVVACSRGR